MRFSVLLPTRNGGRFLRDCISSILEEPYDDFELIVSDNANTDETQEVIKSFTGDSRLKALRLEKPVSVTDNWNHALSAGSGDYFLMMGDDDCLLPGYFKRMEDVLKKYDNPDCVTYNAFTYVTPNSINGNTRSYYNKVHFKFGPDFTEEGLIAPWMRFSIVRDMYRFRVRIPLNMQTTLVARKAAARIQGGVFHPPFPDQYALNALLLSAERWIYLPENLLIVGVSPKSFGHFVYSNQQEMGLNYLGIESDFNGRLPGNELINHMHVWLSLLKTNYRVQLNGIEISRSDYVRRQAYHWYMQHKTGAISFGNLMGKIRALSLNDWCGLFLSVMDRESWIRVLRMFGSRKRNTIQQIWHGLCPVDNVASIRDFRAWVGKTGGPAQNELYNMFRIGYVPYSRSLDRPGDKRRFCCYAKKRNIRFEIADSSRTYNIVVVTERGDLSVWRRYNPGKTKIIYDFIDSYLAVPRYDLKGILRGLAKYISGESRYPELNYWKAIEGMCRRADAVVCSTKEQKQDIQKFCSSVHVVLDFHNSVAREVKHDYSSGDVFNFVWEGLPYNIGSLFLIRDVLMQLKARYKIALHIVTDLEYYKYMGRYWRQSTISLTRKLFDNVVLHEWNEKTCASIIAGCDLALIPISFSDPLAAGKPENKLLLFWRMGLPVVVSATPAYLRAMQRCGLPMACRTKGEWLETLEKYINDKKARSDAGVRGRVFSENYYSEEKTLALWDEVFRSVA